MASDSFSSDPASTDFDAFCDFVVKIKQQGAENLTPEQSVAEFRDYQQKLRLWNERNELSQQQADRGEAEPLDDQAVLSRLRQRLAREGKLE